MTRRFCASCGVPLHRRHGTLALCPDCYAYRLRVIADRLEALNQPDERNPS